MAVARVPPDAPTPGGSSVNVEAAESVVPGPNRSRASSCAASTARSHGTQSLPQCDTILAPVALAVASWRSMQRLKKSDSPVVSA